MRRTRYGGRSSSAGSCDCHHRGVADLARRHGALIRTCARHAAQRPGPDPLGPRDEAGGRRGPLAARQDPRLQHAHPMSPLASVHIPFSAATEGRREVALVAVSAISALVVEDPSLRGVLARQLSRAGFVVHEAHGEEDAVRRASEALPDVVVLDLVLDPRAALDRLPWRAADDVSSNVTEVLVARLRHKLAAAGGGVEIRTVRRTGYRVETAGRAQAGA